MCTVLEDVNAEVATGSYMNSIGCAQVPSPRLLVYCLRVRVRIACNAVLSTNALRLALLSSQFAHCWSAVLLQYPIIYQ